MKTWKRGLASLLAATMLFSMAPTSVFATEETSAYGDAMPAYGVSDDAQAAPDTGAPPVADAPEVADADADAQAAPDTEAPSVETADAALKSVSDVINPSALNPGNTNAYPANPGWVKQSSNGDEEEEPAYEVSYNLSGSGYWITVGDDKRRAQQEDQYVLFDENGDYDIQLRENDDFSGGYKVEIRCRMKAGENWSAPETVTFSGPNRNVTIAGHKFRAQSKWLTRIGYSFNVNANQPDVTPAQDAYDEDGNCAIDFPANGHFPLTVRFWYQTRNNAQTNEYSNWMPTRVTTPDEGEHDPVYEDMHSAFNILGRTFSLNKKTLGLVQYRYPGGEWVNIGPGQNVANPDGGVREEREFDAHGNYTLDMGSRTDFPISVYFRALETDGWKYLSGAKNESDSVKRYINVFDTANINGHVFSIHTTWMNDVRYAFFDETTLNEAKNDYTLTDNAMQGRWTIIGEGPQAVASFEKDGSYTISVSPGKSYPFYLIFQSISPTGDWNKISAWKNAEERMSHLRYFKTVDDTAEYDDHTFYLTTINLGDITFSVRNGAGIVTHSATMVQNKKDKRLEDKSGNYLTFDADDTHTIELTTEDTFPLTVTFKALDKNGWSDDIIWEIPFKGWEKSQKVIRVLGKDYTFLLSMDFLDDTRYRWDDYASWTYVVPDVKAQRYFRQQPYDEKGGYVIPIPNPDDSDVFVANGDAYKLNRPLTIQYWEPEKGWTSAEGDFVSLTDVHQITTADNQKHSFGLSSIYSDEVRFSFPGTLKHAGWFVVGRDEETADGLFDRNDYVISFEEYDERIPFPRPVSFEAYTEHGWDKPQVTLVGDKNATAQEGRGEFQKAGDVLQVVSGKTTRRFTAYYPWANSVRYTITNRSAKDSVTVTIGPDKDFAQENEKYFYFPANQTVVIDMDEGDFFPLPVEFEAKDAQGSTTTIEVKDSGKNALKDENGNLIRNVTFTKNDRSEIFYVGDYKFVAESNWMNTVRVHLPERTVAVGDGIGANNKRLSDDWLSQHPNYKLFDANGDYTIQLRQTDAFPLDVEFLQRSVEGDAKPVIHTFRSVTDTWDTRDFGERHTFRLKSDYTDTARYILSYGENLTDQSGVLWPEVYNGNRAVTVVTDADWAKNYGDYNYAAFDQNGNFQIPLPDDGECSALPVDVWFAVPDENGAYTADTVYQKVTFNSKDDKIIVGRDGENVKIFADETPPGGADTPTHTFSVYAEWMDEVRYTLPKVPDKPTLPNPQEITVGPDKERAERESVSAREERREPLYATYDEKGEYTIELEEDAFFPYVVNVKYHLPFREALIPDYDEEGQLVASRDAQGRLIAAFDKDENLVEKNGFVWKWAPVTEALIPAFSKDGAVIRTNGQRVKWVNAVGEENALPDLDQNGDFRRDENNDILRTKPETRPAESEGQFEFLTPGSSVTWNGHVFKVHSKRVNPNAAVRANLVLGEGTNKRSVIPFRLAGMPGTPDDANIVDETPPKPEPVPEPKPTQDDSITPAQNDQTDAQPNINPNPSASGNADNAALLSTQPLTEVQLYVNLEGYFNLELDNARVELYMPDIANDGEKLAEEFVWGEWNMENYWSRHKAWNVNPWNRTEESVSYRILTPQGQQENPLKLSQYSTTDVNGRPQYFEIISGSTEQLNLSNIRYVIRADMKTPDYNNLLKMKVAYVDDRRGGVRVTRDEFEYYDEASGHRFADQPAGLSTNSEDVYTAEYKTTDENGLEVTRAQRIGVYRFTVDETWLDGKLWMTVKRNKDAASYSMFKNLDADIYEGLWFTAKDAQANGKKIDKPLWERELDTQRESERYASYTAFVNGPKGVQNGPKFTIIWKNGDDPIGIMPFRVIVDVDTVNRQQNNQQQPEEEEIIIPVEFLPPRTHNDFIPDENGNIAPSSELERSKEVVDDDGLLVAYYYTQTEGSLFDDRYYVRATYRVQGHTWAGDGVKVYAGAVRYDTLAQAEAAAKNGENSRAMDVTRQIFSVAGFGADYSENSAYRNGVVFSAFDRDGVLIASKKIVTERREFLTFGRMTSPMGGLYDTDKNDPDYRKGLKSEMERNGEIYNSRVLYKLPDSEYRGIYSGRALYNLPVGYMRDLVPSAPEDYGVTIVAAKDRFDTYKAAMESKSNPVELTPPKPDSGDNNADANGDNNATANNATANNATANGANAIANGANNATANGANATANGANNATADGANNANSGENAEPKPLTFNYTASYRNGVYFHLFNAEGKLIDCRYVYAEEPPQSKDTYFEAYSAQNENGVPYLSYAMPGNMDTYFSNGYQTILLLNQDGTPVTDKRIIPVFDTVEKDERGNQVRVYAGTNLIAGELQETGKTPQPFSGAGDNPIPYSAAATNQIHLKNYWVTYLTQQKGGPKLFVNTANDNSGQNNVTIGKRHIFLQQEEGSYQDIFIANIGDEPLRDITLTLEKGENSLLRVDDYWTLKGGSDSRTLAAFTAEAITNAQNGLAPGRGRYDNYWDADVQPANVMKIRVYPKVSGSADALEKINEDLIISGVDAGGRRQEARINFDGSIGQYRITTEYLSGEGSTPPKDGSESVVDESGKTVPVKSEWYDDYTKDAVKYVAFSRVIQTDWDQSDGGVYFEVTNGRLPDGFPAGYRQDEYLRQLESGMLTREEFNLLQQIRPNGEIFGVPLETGEFTFTVTATFSYTLPGASDPLFTSTDSKEYTLKVLENTDANVEGSISDEYGVLSWIPDMTVTSEEILETETPLGEQGQSRKNRIGVKPVTLNGYQDVKFEFEVEPEAKDRVKDYEWVVGLYLNGRLLDEGTDYWREKGSDVDHVNAKTIKEQCVSGTNTISVVARKNGDQNSAWTKQSDANFNVNKPKSSSPTPVNPRPVNPTPVNPTPVNPTPVNPTPVNPSPSGGGGGGGSSSGGSSGPTAYAITAKTPSHGSVSVSPKSAAKGETVTVTVRPDKGYKVDSVSATGTSNNKKAADVTNAGNNKFTFTMPSRKVTVNATFEKIAYAVSPQTAEHGTITLDSSTATADAVVNGSAAPDKGYLLSSVIVRDADGKTVDSEAFNNGRFTFLMPYGNVTVSATFEVKRLASFKDIQGPDWFFDDAEWAYNRNILRGTTDEYWEPQSRMSSVTCIVTLERLDGVDLTPFDTGADDGIDNSAWYASAQRWARDNNILLKDRPFGGQEPMTRGECAVMFMNYLRYRGLNVATTSETVFTDAGEMTPDELEAFRLLEEADVFRGYSDGSIRPNAYLSRAHLAAVLHRLSEHIIRAETKTPDAPSA